MGRKANELQRAINSVGAMLPVSSDDDGNVSIHTVWSGVRKALEQLGMYERRFERLAELIDNKYGRIRPATVDTIENGIRQLMSERDRARVTEREDVNQAGLRRLSDALGPHGKGYLDTLSFDDIEEGIATLRELLRTDLEDGGSLAERLERAEYANRGLLHQLEESEVQVRRYRTLVGRLNRRIDALREVRDRISEAMRAEGFTADTVDEQVTWMLRYVNYLLLISEPTMTAEQVNELGEKRAEIMRKYAESPGGRPMLDYIDRYTSQTPPGYAQGGLIPPSQEKK